MDICTYIDIVGSKSIYPRRVVDTISELDIPSHQLVLFGFNNSIDRQVKLQNRTLMYFTGVHLVMNVMMYAIKWGSNNNNNGQYSSICKSCTVRSRLTEYRPISGVPEKCSSTHKNDTKDECPYRKESHNWMFQQNVGYSVNYIIFYQLGILITNNR